MNTLCLLEIVLLNTVFIGEGWQDWVLMSDECRALHPQLRVYRVSSCSMDPEAAGLPASAMAWPQREQAEWSKVLKTA